MDGLWKAVLYVPLWKAGDPPCQELSTAETVMPWWWQWMFPVNETWNRVKVRHWCSQGAFQQPLKFLCKMWLKWRHWCFTASRLAWILSLWKNSRLQRCCGCNWLFAQFCRWLSSGTRMNFKYFLWSLFLAVRFGCSFLSWLRFWFKGVLLKLRNIKHFWSVHCLELLR